MRMPLKTAWSKKTIVTKDVENSIHGMRRLGMVEGISKGGWGRRIDGGLVALGSPSRYELGQLLREVGKMLSGLSCSSHSH